jgi:hypothetical protein
MKLLNAFQVTNAIKRIGHKRTVIIRGENGIGKTAIYHALERDPFFANHIGVKLDCTQMSDGSVWMPDIDRENGISRELPNERFGVSKTNQKGINGARPSLVFLDEIAKAKQYIKDVLAPIVYERTVGNYEMAEGSVVFCGTNLEVEGLGDSIQAHLRNRLVFLTMRKPTQTEWRAWAIENGIDPIVIACTDENPHWFDSFLDYHLGGKYAGKDQSKENDLIFNPLLSQQAYITPRSLHSASDIVTEREYLDTDTLQGLLAGTIGEAGAEVMGAFIRFGDETPAFSKIVSSPSTCPIPSNPVAQIITVLKCVTQTSNREEAEACTEYVMRNRRELQSMFANNIANSTRAALFVTVKPFQALMQDNKIYFSTK